MSHPIPGHVNVKCELCEHEAADSLEFETGNNAEMAVTINLCQTHLDEQEKTGYDFECKYFNQIHEAAWESVRSQADALKDAEGL